MTRAEKLEQFESILKSQCSMYGDKGIDRIFGIIDGAFFISGITLAEARKYRRLVCELLDIEHRR